MLFFGALYFAVPRLTGKTWASAALIGGHVTTAILGVLLLVISLGVAGWTQGQALLKPAVTFAEIASATRPWLLLATAAYAVLLVGNLMLVVNFLQTLAAKPTVPAATLFQATSDIKETA
jgi:cytochrome c oxidase cbb3-type subunit 1